MISKKTRMGLMGVIIVMMVGYLAFDTFIDTPPRPTPRLTQSDNVLAQSDNVLTQSRLPMSKTLSAPLEKEPKAEKKDVVVFTLSPKAELALNELQSTYFSKLRDARLKAQIAEKKSQRELDEYNAPPQHQPPRRTTQDTEPLTDVIINQVEVKSIVKTPTRTTAWIGSLNGQARPIQVGAWVGDAKVIDITSNSVRFKRKGQTIQKYVAAPLPTAKEKKDAKKYQR